MGIMHSPFHTSDSHFPRKSARNGLLRRVEGWVIFSAASLVLALGLGGCTRGDRSPYIAPPLDPDRELRQQQVDRLLSKPEIVLEGPREYYIGPGDELTITLLGRPDILGTLSTQVQGNREGIKVVVTENPMITLPLIGSIKVHGKTDSQLQRELTAAYAQYVINPVLIVTIDKYYHNQVTVLGAVNSPGRYSWEFGDTVLDALFKAGGLSFSTRGGLPPGRVLKIYREKINRKDRSDLELDDLLMKISEENRLIPRIEINIPIEEFILSGNLTYNIPIVPNDVLFIPTAGAVIVQGSVRTPGVTFLGPSMHTLTQVITERGGLRYGAHSRVEIVRTLRDGTQNSYFRYVRDMQDRAVEDFLLQDGDQVFVYSHWFRSSLEWIGAIFRASVATGVSATYSPVP